jgi:hypothetical protein
VALTRDPQPPLILAPQATHELGAAIAHALGVELAPLEEREFEDGEHKVRPLTSCAGGTSISCNRCTAAPRPAPTTSSAACCSSPARCAMPGPGA